MRRYILVDDVTKLSARLDGFSKEVYEVVGCVSLSLVQKFGQLFVYAQARYHKDA